MVQLLVILFGCYVMYKVFNGNNNQSYCANIQEDDDQIIEDYIIMDVMSDGELDGHI